MKKCSGWGWRPGLRSEAEPRKARPPAAHETLLPKCHTATAAGGRAQKKNKKTKWWQ